MTVFDLEDNPGAWFDLEDGGRVQLRTLGPETLKAIRKQTAKRRVEYKRVDGKAERFEVEDVDQDLESALFWDHVIVAWENLFDRNGAPIPCTREKKVLLMSRSKRFAEFVDESLKRLNREEIAQAEGAEKN